MPSAEVAYQLSFLYSSKEKGGVLGKYILIWVVEGIGVEKLSSESGGGRGAHVTARLQGVAFPHSCLPRFYTSSLRSY